MGVHRRWLLRHAIAVVVVFTASLSEGNFTLIDVALADDGDILVNFLQTRVDASEDKAVALDVQTASPRLFIISVTGLPGIELASKMQASWTRTLGAGDQYVNVCDVGCAVASHGSLANVLEMSVEAFPSGKCVNGSGLECEGWQSAQMKFPYGLIHEVQRLKNSGGHMPQWWLIKDDDTYVHVERLMKQVSGIDPRRERAAFGNIVWTTPATQEYGGNETYPVAPDLNSTFGVHGGAGLLLTAALAEELALHHAQRWLKLQEKHIGTPTGDNQYGLDPEINHQGGVWDAQISEVISWVPGSMLINMRDVMGDIYNVCIGGHTATYHMKYVKSFFGDDADIDRSVDLMEACMVDNANVQVPYWDPGPARRPWRQHV